MAQPSKAFKHAHMGAPQHLHMHAEDDDEAKFEAADEEIDLTNARLKAVPPGIAQCHQLTKLVLRQNEIAELPAELLERCGDTLVHLDVYDNSLTALDGDKLAVSVPKLTFLDVSFNELRAVHGVKGFKHLEQLYFIKNKVAAVPAGELPETLKILELGDNRLRKIENLDTLSALRELYLGNNKITTIENLGALAPTLTKLSLQQNRIVAIGDGLLPLVNLTELYLSEQGISKIEGLHTLTKLRVLDLAQNKIARIEGLETLTQLTDLWLNNNYIANLDDLQNVKGATGMNCIYLDQNPVAQQPDYKQRILAMFPNLEQLDADVIERDDDDDDEEMDAALD